VNHPWYSLTAIESYRSIHAWIQAAFTQLSVSTSLAPTALRAQPGQCFIGFEQFDLLWRGQKIAGAAQRRRRDGLLIQGSVQPPSGIPDRVVWQKAMCQVAVAGQGVRWLPFNPDAPLQQRTDELIQRKYSQSAYNQKR
jgi:lipoate-protein ligase A